MIRQRKRTLSFLNWEKARYMGNLMVRKDLELSAVISFPSCRCGLGEGVASLHTMSCF